MAPPIISCVVDNKPVFHTQAWIWGVTLRGASDPETIRPIIHHVGPAPDAFREKMKPLNIPIVQIEPFGTGPAVYCNKLQQLEPLLAHDPEHVILCDADLAFRASPTRLIQKGVLRAKIVDHPNPPLAILETVLSRLGFAGEPIDAIPTCDPDGRTHRLNFNGGLYVIPGDFLAPLAARWRSYAQACLDQSDLLGGWTKHSDQLGFMLAVRALDLPVSPLPAESNFPTHLGRESYDGIQNVDPEILHYHHLDERPPGTAPQLRPCPLHPAANQQISRVNAQLAKAYRPPPQTRPLRKQLVLHVGLPKTGTTAMQAWFAEHAEAMRAYGVCYPQDPPLTQNKQLYIVPELRQTPALPRLEALLDTARDETTLLISHEGLSNHFYDFPPRSLERFRELTRDWEVTVAVFTRAPETWLPSYYRQCVLNPTNAASDLWGTSRPLEALRDHPRILRLLDQDQILADMTAGFGATRLLRFEHETPAAFHDFLGNLDLGALAALPLPVTNQSLPGWAVELIRQVNGLVPDQPGRDAWKTLVARFTATTHYDLSNLAKQADGTAPEANPELFDRISPGQNGLDTARIAALREFIVHLRNGTHPNRK